MFFNLGASSSARREIRHSVKYVSVAVESAWVLNVSWQTFSITNLERFTRSESMSKVTRRTFCDSFRLRYKCVLEFVNIKGILCFAPYRRNRVKTVTSKFWQLLNREVCVKILNRQSLRDLKTSGPIVLEQIALRSNDSDHCSNPQNLTSLS